MKKILMLLVAASIVFGAIGCSKAEEGAGTATTTGTTDTPKEGETK